MAFDLLHVLILQTSILATHMRTDRLILPPTLLSLSILGGLFGQNASVLIECRIQPNMICALKRRSESRDGVVAVSLTSRALLINAVAMLDLDRH